MRYIIILCLILSSNYADSQNKIFYNAADVYNVNLQLKVYH